METLYHFFQKGMNSFSILFQIRYNIWVDDENRNKNFLEEFLKQVYNLSSKKVKAAMLTKLNLMIFSIPAFKFYFLNLTVNNISNFNRQFAGLYNRNLLQ